MNHLAHFLVLNGQFRAKLPLLNATSQALLLAQQPHARMK